MKNWEALREWMAGKTVRYAGKDWASTWQLGPGTSPSVVGRCLIEHPDGWEVYVEPCTFLDAVKQAKGTRGQWLRRRSRGILFSVTEEGTLRLGTTAELFLCLIADDYLASDWEPVPTGE